MTAMQKLIAQANLNEVLKHATQKRIVYDTLCGRGDRGLTNHEAVSLYGIGSLSRRITELKRMGVNVKAHRQEDRTVRYFIERVRVAA